MVCFQSQEFLCYVRAWIMWVTRVAIARASQSRSLAEQIVQRRFRTSNFSIVLSYESARLRLEVITEVRLVLLAHLLRRRLLAMLGIRSVVLDAHLAYMQFGVASLAHVKAPQRQTQRRKRSAAAPAD
jgi:hypothetical protein